MWNIANLDLIPVLAGEGILGLLLKTLLALRQSLVPVKASRLAQMATSIEGRQAIAMS